MGVKSAALWVSFVIASQPAAAGAQSASKVIERYITAIGGKKAVEQISSSEVTGTVTSGDGRDGVFMQRSRRPQLFVLSVSWGDSRLSSGFNGRAAWQDDGADGPRTLYGEAASRARTEGTYVNSRFLLSEKRNQVMLAGQARVRDRPAVVVDAIAPDGASRRLFFDAESYLLVKDEQQTEAGIEERVFDDYRRVGQVMEPHRIEWRRNGETLRIAVERVTHNMPLGEQLFDVPGKPEEPPLDIAAFRAAVVQSEWRAVDTRGAYAYIQTTSARKFDQQGRTLRPHRL